MSKLTFKQLKPGMRVILHRNLPKGFDANTAFCDIVVSETRRHLNLKYIRLKWFGSMKFEDASLYLDSPKTRTWLLLNNTKIEEVK